MAVKCPVRCQSKCARVEIRGNSLSFPNKNVPDILIGNIKRIKLLEPQKCISFMKSVHFVSFLEMKQRKIMKLCIIKYGGTKIELECDSFEFRTNQVANWIELTQGGKKNIIHNIAVIRTISELESS